MNSETFERVVDEQIQECRDILVEKAKEYATGDRLHNFKRAAELQGTSPEEALAGMMAKHTISIYDLCTGATSKDDDEVWNEKITDSINYLLLLKALRAESSKKSVKDSKVAFDSVYKIKEGRTQVDYLSLLEKANRLSTFDKGD